MYLLRFKVFDLGPYPIDDQWSYLLLTSFQLSKEPFISETTTSMWNRIFFLALEKLFWITFCIGEGIFLHYKLWSSCVLTIISLCLFHFSLTIYTKNLRQLSRVKNYLPYVVDRDTSDHLSLLNSETHSFTTYYIKIASKQNLAGEEMREIKYIKKM